MPAVAPAIASSTRIAPPCRAPRPKNASIYSTLNVFILEPLRFSDKYASCAYVSQMNAHTWTCHFYRGDARRRAGGRLQHPHRPPLPRVTSSTCVHLSYFMCFYLRTVAFLEIHTHHMCIYLK